MCPLKAYQGLRVVIVRMQVHVCKESPVSAVRMSSQGPRGVIIWIRVNVCKEKPA